MQFWPNGERSWFSAIEMFLTIVIVVLIAIELYAGASQLTALQTLDASIKQQMSEQKTAFNEMNQVLTNLVNVSEKAAETAKKSEEESLRAYLGIRVASQTVKVGQKVSVTLQAENSGHTPAINCSFRVFIAEAANIEAAHDAAVKSGFYDRNAKFLGQLGSKTSVFPGQSLAVPGETSTVLTEEENAALEKQLFTEYAFGYMWYTDAFGKLQQTSSCYFYYVPQKQFGDCVKYNSTSLRSE